jgi:putative transposase
MARLKRSRSTRAAPTRRRSKVATPSTKLGIEIRQVKYLNNIVEQDHRAIKRLVRPMLGFKSFWCAAVTLTGIELMHMIRKGQLLLTGELCPAQQFYSLAE